MTCAVAACPLDGDETIELSARCSNYQPDEYVLHEVELKVMVCRGHHHLLTSNLLRVAPLIMART